MPSDESAAALPLVIERIDDLRERVDRWRRGGQRIALVPTMGNLHDGHLSLVRQARTRADRVIVSIFVNPLQFGEGEDFESYPRTLDEDRAKLATVGAHAVFHPSVHEMYPDGTPMVTEVRLHALEAVLCGEHREGHFAGVATVVTKLFGLVQPDVAVFGRKDYQQLTLIRRMVRDLSLPIRVIASDTVREDDGLAMSSRNRYLTAEERAIAPALNATLRDLAGRLGDVANDVSGACAAAEARLAEAGFRPDYVRILDASTLTPPTETTRRVVIAGAGHLGRARLIDNVTADWPRG
ncbi:MAG: pantoate--beta-alanine ligase [Pseudomonadota bacterium]